jgi:HTH-type transcriptional regulator/antitoxin HigA
MGVENIKPIKSESDYQRVLTAIDELMGAAPGTPESDQLEVLVALVEAYEARHWPIEAPDPISALEHVMEARGLRQKDLGQLIGSQSHASEILNRRRPLTLGMIRSLSAEWGIPAYVLVSAYELATTA